MCLCVVGSGVVVGFGYYGCSPKRFWGLAPKCRRRICRSFSSHRRFNFACHCYLRYTPVKPTSQTRRNPQQLTAIHHSQNYGNLRLERCLHCLYELEAFHLFTSTYGLLAWRLDICLPRFWALWDWHVGLLARWTTSTLDYLGRLSQPRRAKPSG